MLLSVKLQASACNFTKSNTPRWMFSRFFKLYKWYQIAQSKVSHLNRLYLREWKTKKYRWKQK